MTSEGRVLFDLKMKSMLLILALFGSAYTTLADRNKDTRNLLLKRLKRAYSDREKLSFVHEYANQRFCSVTVIPADHKCPKAFMQEDRWDWGYVIMPAPSLQVSSEPGTRALDESYNPCLNTTYSPKPDFIALGKRISETKCYEYIWEVKHRDEMAKRSEECIAYRMKHRGANGPHFAIGGRDTKPGEFPHMGAIGWQASVGTWVFKCGCTLISSRFVLTAAHCSRGSTRDTTIADPVPKIVRLGDKNIIDKVYNGVLPKDEKIIRIIVHPKFSSPKKYYDIGLMELENDVIFTRFIQPACLWTQFDTSSLGTEATLTGWGVVETGSRSTSPELQAAVVDLIGQSTCDRLLRPSCYRHWCGMEDHQLCAGKLAGGVDACQGDSGGPLQVQIRLPITTQGSMHYVIGVTSFGIDCALPNLPGIYTRVSSFVDWIEANVWR